MRHRELTPLVLAVTAGLTASSFAFGAPAGDSKELAGNWIGTIKPAGKVELRLIFRVTKGPEGHKAVMISPDQTEKEIPVSLVSVEGSKVRFEVKGVAGAFAGTFDEAGTEIVGEWTQPLTRLPLTLRPATEADLAGPVAPKVLRGLWEGSLGINDAVSLRLVLRVEPRPAGGPLTPYLDSPDQGVNGIPISVISLKDGELRFECKGIGGSYTGKLDPEKGEIAGRWKQGPLDLPLTLKKTDKRSERARPQQPRPPFPYRVEEIAFDNPAAGVRLAGTLTLPEGKGPFPAALLITGSGPQDRDETLFGHKPFLVLADHLTRQGIATLRVDDRGVGGSTGSLAEATSADLAGDALAGFRFLKSRSEIDPQRIGLIGHSEGGLIAPMAAVQSGDVAFLVLLAGTGLPGDWIIARQLELIARANGADEGDLTSFMASVKRLIAVIESEPIGASPVTPTETLLKPIHESLPEKLREGSTGTMLQALAGQLRTPWFRSFLTYDPRPALKRVTCPVLALNGEKDLQVPATENLAEIRQALEAGGNRQVTVESRAGLNHLFQPCKTGSPLEYGQIEQTFDQATLERISAWIRTLEPR